MNREEEIPVPVWFLEHIEDTLRIENNINNEKKTGETCQDRNIKQALNGVRKVLSGDALTGNERLEPLKPYNAKKDLALTWKDVRNLCDCFMNVDLESNLPVRSKKFYTEVLNRFNKSKEKK